MDGTSFFRMVLRKFSEITENKPIFSQYNIFYNYKYFFQSAFWSLFNHSQRSQSNHEQSSLCCSLPCSLVLLCTHYGPLHCKLKEIGVLRSIFSDCYFLWLCSRSTDNSLNSLSAVTCNDTNSSFAVWRNSI